MSNPLPPTSTSSVTARFLIIALLIFAAGLALRIAAFEISAPIRVLNGLNNAWSKGDSALNLGHNHFFDGVVALYDPTPGVYVDYPPIRAYIKTAWVLITRSNRNAPGSDGNASQRFDSILWPMLTVNALAEFSAALALFALCRLKYSPSASLLAASIFWLNPVLILNSFCWPQWDSWPLAPVLISLYWLLNPKALAKLYPHALAGIAFTIAATLKGQSLFVLAPLLALSAGRTFLYSPSSVPSIPQKLQRATLALLTFLLAAALALFIITLPFTLRGSLHWLDIYTMQFHRDLPLSIDAWNLPYFLQEVLHLTPASHALHTHFTLNGWLKIAFVLATLAICILALRTRDITHALLAPGITFLAMYALMPCMYERYSLWGALLTTPLLLRKTPYAILTYSLVNLLALPAPLYFCLTQNPTVAPALATTLHFLSPAIGLSSFLATAALAATLLQKPPLPTSPNPKI